MNQKKTETNRKYKSITEYSSNGGCNCKAGRNSLNKIISDIPRTTRNDIILGFSTSDDAAVQAITPGRYVVTSLDYQTPVTDDPFIAGEVAAANAISDIYAMGATPRTAAMIIAFPFDLTDEYDPNPKKMVDGITSKCREAGIMITGGHTINAPIPLLGLNVIGEASPRRIKTNSGAKDGDLLVLTKAIGNGIYTTAYKNGVVSEKHFSGVLESMSKLNSPGEWLSSYSSVSSMTDVTGFGLAAHTLEICDASNVDVHLSFKSIPSFHPLITNHLCKEGHLSSLAWRNFNDYSNNVVFDKNIDPDLQMLLFDGQTNGGLIFTINTQKVDEILERLNASGFENSCVIGSVKEKSGEKPKLFIE